MLNSPPTSAQTTLDVWGVPSASAALACSTIVGQSRSLAASSRQRWRKSLWVAVCAAAVEMAETASSNASSKRPTDARSVRGLKAELWTVESLSRFPK